MKIERPQPGQPFPTGPKYGKIFLAGPTPRNPAVKSWRPEALDLLRRRGYNGTVFVPEGYPVRWCNDWEYQIRWEHRCLEISDKILMWVPRNLDNNPGFTTNVEFGYYLSSRKLYYGRPDDAPETKYLDAHYERCTGRAPVNRLSKLVEQLLPLGPRISDDNV